MSNLERCREYLESVGADYLDVGCAWQENDPMTLAEKAENITGLLVWLSSLLLLWALVELANKHSKKQ